jgi:hypothetical protein
MVLFSRLSIANPSSGAGCENGVAFVRSITSNATPSKLGFLTVPYTFVPLATRSYSIHRPR